MTKLSELSVEKKVENKTTKFIQVNKNLIIKNIFCTPIGHPNN